MADQTSSNQAVEQEKPAGFVLDLTEISYDAKPEEFKGATFWVRPYPNSEANMKFEEGGVRLEGAERWKCFNHSLTKWENLVAADGTPITFSTKTKKLIFDHNLGGIPGFVLEKAQAHNQALKAQEKN